jgi:hypothetical protein
MNPAPFSARQVLPGSGQLLSAVIRVLWLGMNRPQWFLLAVLPLLL